MFHPGKRICLIAEAEGDSSGQPEQKLYKALGQLVMAAGVPTVEGWERALVLVVHGDQMAKHLGRAHALTKLGVSALVLDANPSADRWIFRDALLPKLLSGELRVPAK